MTALALATLTYLYPPESRHTFGMEVSFDGFIPILGGQEGKAQVRMEVLVQGLSPEGENPRAVSELTKAEIRFNGAKLPLDLANVQDFFPRTTAVFSPRGKVLKNDAPAVELPIKLPGLDARRFPEISYLPVELPEGALATGKSWSFVRPFAGSEVTYTCTVRGIDGGYALIDLTVRQTYTVLEDAALGVVTDREDAEAEVTTTMVGKGTLLWDLGANLPLRYKMEGVATSDVKPVRGGEKSTRTLKITFEVTRKVTEGPKAPPGSAR